MPAALNAGRFSLFGLFSALLFPIFFYFFPNKACEEIRPLDHIHENTALNDARRFFYFSLFSQKNLFLCVFCKSLLGKHLRLQMASKATR
tara:strand:- start:1644 stop:1913 length:270 start_codon:yes stop_codon:yes gene_type:complete